MSNLQPLSKTTPPSRLRPYLTTPQLISLAAFASPVISLLFILFRLRASSDLAQQSVSDAKNTLQASCLAAERAASVGASLPRYLAIDANEKITESVRATMEGVRIALTLSLTATEAIIEFIIDMYRSTFLCFLELVVRGGLAIVIEAVTSITSFINSTLSNISSGINNDIQSANNVIQAAVNVVKQIPLVGDQINVPQFSIPSAANLSSIQIPTTFEDQLKTLNSSLPTLEDLREKLDNLISIPFQLLKKEINDTFLEAQSTFIATPLPVPEQATVSFCGDTISNTFDNLAVDLVKVAEIGVAIVIASMVLLFLLHAFLTWYSQRSLRNNIERIRLLWFGEGVATADRLLAFDALVSHPLWSRIVRWLTEKFRLRQEKYDALTWFGLYVFHPAPLACLLIGVFGILSVQIQLLIISPLQHQYSNEISNNINDLTGIIATKLNDTMWQDSGAYAQAFNAKIDNVQNTINSDLFGWVNATIVPLNNTIADFYAEVQDAVNTLFGNTPFDSPAQEFVKCILGSKVSSIEKALTFLQENLQVDLPHVNTSALVLSPASVNEVAQPISAAAVGSGDDGSDGGVIGQIIIRYIESLKKEQITFFVFLLLWLSVVVAAMFIIAWNFWFAPALKRKGFKRPHWLFGNEWDDPQTGAKPFYLQDPEKSELDHKASFVPTLTPPHRKDVGAGLSSATMFGADHDRDRLRYRGQTPTRMTSDVDVFTANESQQQSTIFSKLKGISLGRRATHSAKQSDPMVLPTTTRDPRENGDGYGWARRLTFWKRGGEAVDDDRQKSTMSNVPKSRFSEASTAGPSRPRTKPGLRVDTTKAANAPSIQPRVILEIPDVSLEPFVPYVPPVPSATSTSRSATPARSLAPAPVPVPIPVFRKASTDTESSSRPKRRMDAPRQDASYLTVPSQSQSRAMRKPTPPDWVLAAQNKRMPAIPSSSTRRPSEGSGRGNIIPQRPPGLPALNLDGTSGYSSAGAQSKAPLRRGDSTESKGSARSRDERRQKRRSSVPPVMERSNLNGQQRQNQNQRNQRTLSRSSSFDSADPFADPFSTPMKLNKPLLPMELPAPLQPIKLQTTGSASAAPVESRRPAAPALISIPPELGNPFPKAINRVQNKGTSDMVPLKNPFATPFDDSYAIAAPNSSGSNLGSEAGAGAGAPSLSRANLSYNFSMPSRQRDLSA